MIAGERLPILITFILFLELVTDGLVEAHQTQVRSG